MLGWLWWAVKGCVQSLPVPPSEQRPGTVRSSQVHLNGHSISQPWRLSCVQYAFPFFKNNQRNNTLKSTRFFPPGLSLSAAAEKTLSKSLIRWPVLGDKGMRTQQLPIWLWTQWQLPSKGQFRRT